jgi:hypothetical protein
MRGWRQFGGGEAGDIAGELDPRVLESAAGVRNGRCVSRAKRTASSAPAMFS